MANPTSNFNWQMPTASDLVTDLPADFEVFGQAVDTSLADLKGGTTGQVLSKTSGTDMDFTWVTTDDANAIQNAIVDAKGDLVAASAADTPARLAVGNNGETLVADSSTATGLRYQGLFGANKNAILNADFRINQRAFTSTTTSATYGFDRWRCTLSGGTVTYSAQTFTAGAAPVAGYEGINYARLVTTSQSASSDRAVLNQLVEDVRTLSGQTVTVSFWAQAGTGTPNINVVLNQNFGSGGSSSVNAPTPTAKAISTSWARYSFTIANPSVSGKTITGDSRLNVQIYVSDGGDQSTGVGAQNNTFNIWGVQLEAGSVATPFQTATGTIQGELAACQRYYYRQSLTTAAQFLTGLGIATSTTVATIQINNPVPLRTVGTSIDYANVNLYDGVLNNAATGAAIQASTLTSTVLGVTSTGLTQFRPYWLLSATTNSFIGIGAEL
jgi:hypothetical protein